MERQDAVPPLPARPPAGVSPASGDTPRVYVGAYALCVRAGCLLLVRISPAEADSGKWTLPGGGLEWGEAPERGVLRELEEETGITGQVTGVAGVFSATYLRSPDRPAAPVHHIGILYFVEPFAGEIREEEQGTTDLCAWVPIDEMTHLPLVPLAAYGRDLVQAAR